MMGDFRLAVKPLALSFAERAQLDALTLELEPDLRAERKAGRDFAEVLSESSLLRFLRAAQDPQTAAANFRESLPVRERLGANALRQRLLSAHVRELWRFERLPHAERVLSYFAEFLPTGTLDRSGNVVLFLDRSLMQSFQQLREAVSKEEYLEFRVAREVQMQLLLHALTEQQGRLVQQTVIVDLNDIRLSELVLHATSHDIKQYRGSFDTQESFLCWPETGSRLYMVNTPLLIAPTFNLFKRMLPAATVRKYAFPGRAYKATLLEAIEAEALPLAYGGKLAVPSIASLVRDTRQPPCISGSRSEGDAEFVDAVEAVRLPRESACACRPGLAAGGSASSPRRQS
jgi:hypothetical protein